MDDFDVSDLHTALRAAREDTLAGPHRIHGTRAAIMDLLLDSGAQFGMDRIGAIPSQVYGLDVIFEESMPTGCVDFRNTRGRTFRRLIQVNGRWFEFDPSVIDVHNDADG